MGSESSRRSAVVSRSGLKRVFIVVLMITFQAPFAESYLLASPRMPIPIHMPSNLMDASGRHPSCGELHFNKEGIGSNLSNGHGMLIGEDLFITAYHVLDTGFSVIQSAWIKFDGCDPVKAMYIDGDFNDDIAIMRLESIPGVKPCPIATRNPIPGEQLFLQAARHRDQCFVPFISDPLTCSDMVCGQMHCWQGESGTGILNMSGELVGILTGGWMVCKDKDGKNITRAPDGAIGPVTNKVYPTMSRSTPLEIWDLVNKNAEKIAKDSPGRAAAGSDGIIETFDGDMRDLHSGRILVVLSADWCGPCQRLKANLKKWEPDLSAAGIDKILVVDGDKYPAIKRWMNATVFPTVGKCIDGKLVSKWNGAPSKEQIIKGFRK